MEVNFFAKNYGDSRLAEAEFERTLSVYRQVSRLNPSYLRIAKPIQVKDSTVYFEKLVGCVNLRKATYKFCIDTEILYYVGQALAQLHLALNPQLVSLEEDIHIHGDLWTSNILYRPSEHLIYFVDFSPSRYMEPGSYSYGSAYLDLAQVIYSLEIKYPLYRMYLLARRKNKVMSARFLAGYEEVIRKKVDREKLCEYIVRDIDIGKLIFKRKNPVSRFVWVRLFERIKKRYISQKSSFMEPKPPLGDYRNSHTRAGTGYSYEYKSFARNSAASSLWQLEQDYLADVIIGLVAKRERYLDFACGTGRIIEAFADSFTEVVGIDVSESMLSVAKQKNIKAKLLQGDITKDTNIVGDNFDLITAFRFFLRAQDSLGHEVIDILTRKLSPNGFLIFNIHNSRPSFLWFQNCIMNFFRSRKVPSMSQRQVAELAKGAGLEIVEKRAMGIVPKAAHIVFRPKLWQWVDRGLGKVEFLQKFGSDVVYVCRRMKNT